MYMPCQRESMDGPKKREGMWTAATQLNDDDAGFPYQLTLPFDSQPTYLR